MVEQNVIKKRLVLIDEYINDLDKIKTIAPNEC